jgi:hypothetical protein
MKLLLAFALAGLLLLCATYSTLVYYRMIAIAKGIEPYGRGTSSSLKPSVRSRSLRSLSVGVNYDN